MLSSHYHHHKSKTFSQLTQCPFTGTLLLLVLMGEISCMKSFSELCYLYFYFKILKALVATSEEKEVKQALGQNDSDKENDGDAPMDLSKAVNTIKDVSELQPITGDDVIMLSDEDDDLSKFVNGFRNVSPDELKQTRKAIRKLQEDLRNEETKLVLLKKLRQSQLIATSLDGNSVPNKAAQPPSKVLNRPVSQQNPTPSRGNQQPAHAHVNKPQTVQQMQQRAQLNQSNHVSGNRVTSNRSNSAAPAHQTSNQAGQPGRQTSSAQVAAYRGSQQTVSKPTQPEQSPSQRQAAAKLALRKQLEKTLLQIPPPKPPPPEMNFIPSTASGDFIPLVGLEEVVKFIVEADARNKGGKVPEVKYVFNPFTCVQCGTDFTPVWKRDKPGSKNVICEQCVTSNQKKALKQEHTNRLKSAFVKALQQEQEIEQRMQQTEKTSQTNSASSGSTQTTTHTKPTSQSHQRSTPVTAHSHASSSSATSARSSGSSHSSGSSASSSSNYKAEQMRQHQNLLQVHQQQLRSLGLVNLQNFAPHLPFPYQPQLTAKQAADLQRQYLLDMIQPRSVPGGASIWRNK